MRLVRGLLVAVALMMPLLAGCSSDDPAPPAPEPTEDGPPLTIEAFEDPNHYCVVNGHRDRVHAPDLEGKPWTLGQWWTYDLQLGDDAPTTTKLVYYEDQDEGAHYMVGTPTREEALMHGLFSTNPMIGRIHAALYSPHESGDHADMFHFPLCEGSGWSTVFFGESFSLTASKTMLDLPEPVGRSPGFIISGTSDSGSKLTLTYSLPAQWFTLIDLRRGDGSPAVLMQLKALGQGYSGPAFFLRAQQDYVLDLAGQELPIDTAEVLREDGKDGAYDTLGISINLARVGGTGEFQVEIYDPNDTLVVSTAVGDLSGNETVSVLTELPYQPGNWTVRRILVAGPALPGALEIEGELRVVSIYDRSGTV